MSGDQAIGSTTRPSLVDLADTVAWVGDVVEVLPDEALDDAELTAEFAHLEALLSIRRAERRHRKAHL